MISTLIYIVIAILILMFMITVHEFGHYIAGKLLGFKINEFAIGFGKPIFKRVSKKTGEVFSIRWLPLGGYCSFAGDEAAAGEGGARAEALERERKGDVPTPKGVDFNKAHPWKRLVVLFAGGFANFLSAIVFAIVLLMFIGYFHAVGISSRMETDVNKAANPNYALLQDVTKIHGVGRDADSVQLLTRSNSLESRLGNYNKDDTFVLRVEYSNGDVENVSGFKLIELDESKRLGIGVIQSGLVWESMGFFDAIGYGIWYCLEVSWMILTLLGKLITGQIGFFGNVGGPVTTVSFMAEVVSWNLVNVLVLVPIISINLALFNLLPIPALDGARMVFVGIEWVRGKPVNPTIEGRIHMFGLLFLFGLIILADVAFGVINGGYRNFGIFLLFCTLLL